VSGIIDVEGVIGISSSTTCVPVIITFFLSGILDVEGSYLFLCELLIASSPRGANSLALLTTTAGVFTVLQVSPNLSYPNALKALTYAAVSFFFLGFVFRPYISRTSDKPGTYVKSGSAM